MNIFNNTVAKLSAAALFFAAASSLAQDQNASSVWALDGVATSAVRQSAIPPFSEELEGQRSIMLTLSLDHQLFLEAYNDYSDIYPIGSPDGIPENTYVHDFTYVGYFDPGLCYSYANGVFGTSGTATAKYCDDPENSTTGGGWSGNFLNWLTMTRMDLVRFVLYGGYRSTDSPATADSPSLTVLERAYLPQDTHSFAKYYPGSDINRLTDGLPSTCSGTGEQCSGYTFCNTTQPDQSIKDKYSQDFEIMALPPLLRAVEGNYSLWASNERYQCVIKSEIPQMDFQGLAFEFDSRGKNGNIPERTGINAFGDVPESATDYTVRVRVCDQNAPAMESFCHTYSEKNNKPRGVLQEKGEGGQVHFGLLTGSYSANKSFGALRKNISSFADEVNADGTFVYPPLSQLVASGTRIPTDVSIVNSIIGNLNALRIIDYKFRSAGDSDQDRAIWSGTYHKDTADVIGNCWWEWTTFQNGRCRNWGNPFSEILAESYLYYANADKMAVSEVNDDGLLPGLTVATWPTVSGTEPDTDGAQACPNMNVLAFNSSSVTYDSGEEHVSDQSTFKNLAGETTNSLFGVSGSTTIQSLTTTLGSRELDATKKYFIGRVSGGSEDGQCTPKEIPGTDLSLVSGTCPEAPNLYGSYWGAGLAHFVHTNDVIPATTERKDTITTYGITLSGAQPKITLDLPPAAPTQRVVIIPACRNRGRTGGENPGPKGNCSLVDFKPVEVFRPNEAGVYQAKYYIGWEDSEQGGDYDLDLSGTLTITYNPSDVSGRPLVVASQIIYESAQSEMHFGYVITGTTNDDGVHFPSRVGSIDDEYNFHPRRDGEPRSDDDAYFDIVNNGGLNEAQKRQQLEEFNRERRVDPNTITSDCLAHPHCANDSTNSRIQIMSFAPGSSSDQGEIESPLFYAAKWGAFDDFAHGKEDSRSGNGLIDDGEERREAYAEVSDPAQLKEALFQAIGGISDKPITGTGAAIATTALTGEGLTLSTLFLPEYGTPEKKVQWVGRLNGLFRADEETWEDSAEPWGVRTDADFIVRFKTDEDNQTVFDRYKLSGIRDNFGRFTQDQLTLEEEGVPYSNLRSVWNARDQLANLSQDTITNQRAYSTQAGSGRYIFTAVDVDDDGQVTDDEKFDFVSDRFSATGITGQGLVEDNFRLIDAGSPENATKVVDYIRGYEGIDGFRNRTVAISQTARNGVTTTADKPWLLGDIIHSTPAMVGRPNELYDSSRIGDASYSKFRSIYAGRRLVTYVGANDGMLHAFNGGFAVPYVEDIGTEDAPELVSRFSYQTKPTAASSVTAHPLGSELWAYVPYNLLPQLKWLTDPNFRHVYYVDSNVNQFDVNIFPHSTTHPEGWGTIIVVGMRFGGSDTVIDVNGTDPDGATTLRSAYIVFDVTDPESAPNLLGEISDPSLGYTMGDIDVISFRDPKPNGAFTISDGTALPKNQWFLVFGSGPRGGDALANATSDQSAKLFALDLNKLARGTIDLESVNIAGSDESYVGGVTAMDWNDDFDDDMLYFGTVGTGDGAGDPKGSLRHAQLVWDNGSPGSLSVTTARLLDDVNLPFSREPLAIKESAFGGYWIYAATGKFVVKNHVDEIDDNQAFGLRVNATSGSFPWMISGSLSSADDLKDVSDVKVITGVTVIEGEGELPDQFNRTFTVQEEGKPDTTPEEIARVIRTDFKGWSKNFRPNELSNTRPFFYGSTLGLTTVSPVTEGCSPSGKSRLYVLNMFNGLPQTESDVFVLGSDGSTTIVNKDSPSGTGELADSIEYDTPLNDASEDGKPIIKCQTGCDVPFPGEMPPGVPTRRSWREVPLDDLN